jgi:hypothetical protein
VTGTGTSNYLPLWTSGSNLGVSKIYQANGGFVGINTNTPLLQLDVNGNSIFRGSFQMAAQGTASASAGQPSHSFQWQSSVYNSSTNAADNLAFGFRTVPDQNNVASPTAKLDLFYGPGGGTLNDLGLSIANTGLVTFVPGQVFSGSVNLGPSGSILSDGAQLIGSGDFGNQVFGAGALPNQSGSEGNVAIGQNALSSLTGANDDVAIGRSALSAATTAGGNIAVGAEALLMQTTGYSNVAVGRFALESTTTGGANVAVGNGAGLSNIYGAGNTFLGNSADGFTGAENSTAIGAQAQVLANNAIVLGSISGVNQATSSVNVGIGVNAPQYTLEVIDQNVGPGTSAILASASLPGHNGVYGTNSAKSGGSNGGFFVSASPSGAGIVATNTGGGLAASLQGNVQITGTLTKGGGSFKIDDPIDPAGKYLSHSFVESPDMKNIYDGNVTTDAHGYAIVTLPPYFEALNRDFRYQLTAFGVFSQAIVAREIKDGKFMIRTTKPHVKVSWQVTGIRHDAWANANRIPNEEEKPASEQGKYLHPELFGAGPDKSVTAAIVAHSSPIPPQTAGPVTALNKQ